MSHSPLAQRLDMLAGYLAARDMENTAATVVEARDDLAEALALLREARAEYVDDDDLAGRVDALLARHPAPE